MAEPKQIDAKDAVRLLWLATQGKLDEATIRKVIGRAEAKSLTEVAKVFGVSVATVRHTWRPNGMPSIGTRGRGSKAPLADILIWLIQRNAANMEARGADEHTKRKREAETRAAEAEARIKETKANVVEGDFVRLVSVQFVLRGLLNVFRDAMLNIPRKWTPRFPAKYASEWTAELETDIRNCLTIVAEKPIEDFTERMAEDVQN